LLRIAQVEAPRRAPNSRRQPDRRHGDRLDAYRLDAEDAGHQLTATICPGIIVSGDQELLTQALANLVENALRHTPSGNLISVRLTDRSQTGVLLSVEMMDLAVGAADLPAPYGPLLPRRTQPPRPLATGSA